MSNTSIIGSQPCRDHERSSDELSVPIHIEMNNRSLTYDPYKLPADIKAAELHYDCNRFGKPTYISQQRSDYASITCPCCSQIWQEQLPMDMPTESLVYFGPAIPLLFQLSKYLMLLMAAYTPANIYMQYRIVMANCDKLFVDDRDVICPSSGRHLIPPVNFDAIMPEVLVSAIYKVIVSMVIKCVYG